jgi:hypothetical protein
MQDKALLKVIAAIPQQSQRQYDAWSQLRTLVAAANKLGLYDAADFLTRELNWRERKRQ